MGLLGNLISPQTPQQTMQQQYDDMYRSLMRYQAQMGAEVFGPIPKGIRREFFCLDERTWVWHEEWKDKTGGHVVTTRYDIRPSGVLKSQNGGGFQALTYEEAQHLYDAIGAYYEKIRPELYRLEHLAA